MKFWVRIQILFTFLCKKFYTGFIPLEGRPVENGPKDGDRLKALISPNFPVSSFLELKIIKFFFELKILEFFFEKFLWFFCSYPWLVDLWNRRFLGNQTKLIVRVLFNHFQSTVRFVSFLSKFDTIILISSPICLNSSFYLAPLLLPLLYVSFSLCR